MLWTLTSFGDTGLLFPVSLLVFVCLLAQKQTGAAFAWAAAMAVCAILTVAAKLGFHLCGAEIEAVDIRSPSGHTSVSTTVYGSLAVLIGAGRPRWQQALIALTAVSLAAVIGVSRVLLTVHTLDEVVLGYVVGAGCVALFALLLARAGWPRIDLIWLLAGCLLALLLLLGSRVSFEGQIARASRFISGVTDVCR